MLSEKKRQRIEKILTIERTQDIDSFDGLELRMLVSNSSASIKHAVDELESNPKYQQIKESLKAVSEGLREVKKLQNAIIQYALSVLEDKGA